MGWLNANPTFENNSTSPWAATGGSMATTAAEAHSGTYSLNLTPTGGVSNSALLSERVLISPGKTYVAAGYVTVAVPSYPMYAMLHWYDASQVFISSVVGATVTVLGTDWTQIVAVGTAPAGAAFARAEFRLTGTPSSAVEFRLDDAGVSQVSIIATANGSYHSPGVDLVLGGLDGFNTVVVERVDTTGQRPDTAVRGLDGISTGGATTVVATDYESPIGVPVEYRVTASGAGIPDGTATSVVVTLPTSGVGTTWLKSVSQPTLSRRVNVADWNDVTYPGRILGEYEVLGRRNKVVITDVLGGREGSLTLATFPFGMTWESDCYWRDLMSLLENGGVLFLQTAGEDFTGERDMYFVIKSLKRSRVGIIGGELVHLHEISYVEIDQPTTAIEPLGLRSWQDILDNFASWDDVKDYYSNWLDVLSRD